MNRYKWLAQYVLRMRNKGISVFKSKHRFKIVYSILRLSIVKECCFLGLEDDYYLKIAMYPKSDNIVPRVKTFRISKTNYYNLLRSFK